MNSSIIDSPALQPHQIAAKELAALWARLSVNPELDNATGILATVSNPILKTHNTDGTAWDHVELTVTISRGQYNGKPAPEYAAHHWKASVSESFVWRMGLGLIDWQAQRKKLLHRMIWNDYAHLWETIRKQGAYSIGTKTLARLAAQCLPSFVKACSPAEVLARVCADAQSANQAFVHWCADFGFDSDSRKAFAAYESCQNEGVKARRLIDGTTFDKLAELANQL